MLLEWASCSPRNRVGIANVTSISYTQHCVLRYTPCQRIAAVPFGLVVTARPLMFGYHSVVASLA